MPNLRGIPVSQDVADLNPEVQDIVSQALDKPSKYHNVKAAFQNMSFQSGHERDVVAMYIALAERGQGVFGLQLQTRFLLPGGIDYYADLTYLDDQLFGHVIDAKAWDARKQRFIRTPEYRLKRKLFKAKYGREIEEL